MSVFRKIPELDWIKSLASDIDGPPCRRGQHSARLMMLYRYLLWSQRFRLTSTATDEGRVANGMMTKYYRQLHPASLSQSMTDYETKFIKESEALRKKMIRAAKKARDK